MPGSSPGMTGAFRGTRSRSASHTHQLQNFKQPINFKRAFAPSRRGAPEALLYLPPKEGVGNAGCPLHPQPRVRFALVKSTRVNEYTGITRRSRTQWFYGLFRALPGDRACLPPSPADRFCLSPVGPTQLRELDTSIGASGPHDFAVRNNISRPRAVDRSQAEACPAIPSHAKRCRVHRIRTPRP
jgi:hypothetical protein